MTFHIYVIISTSSSDSFESEVLRRAELFGIFVRSVCISLLQRVRRSFDDLLRLADVPIDTWSTARLAKRIAASLRVEQETCTTLRLENAWLS